MVLPWNQLVALGKGFPLVTLGENTMGQTRACCHVPSHHCWFHARSKSAVWVAGGGTRARLCSRLL